MFVGDHQDLSSQLNSKNITICMTCIQVVDDLLKIKINVILVYGLFGNVSKVIDPYDRQIGVQIIDSISCN